MILSTFGASVFDSIDFGSSTFGICFFSTFTSLFESTTNSLFCHLLVSHQNQFLLTSNSHLVRSIYQILSPHFSDLYSVR